MRMHYAKLNTNYTCKEKGLIPSNKKREEKAHNRPFSKPLAALLVQCCLNPSGQSKFQLRSCHSMEESIRL